MFEYPELKKEPSDGSDVEVSVTTFSVCILWPLLLAFTNQTIYRLCRPKVSSQGKPTLIPLSFTSDFLSLCLIKHLAVNNYTTREWI